MVEILLQLLGGCAQEVAVGDTDLQCGWENGSFRKLLVGGPSGGNCSVNLGFGWYFIQITVICHFVFLPHYKGRSVVSWSVSQVSPPIPCRLGVSLAERIYLGKRKACKPEHADRASHVQVLACANMEGIYRREKE